MFTRQRSRFLVFLYSLLSCAYADVSFAATKWVSGYYPLYQRNLYPNSKIDFASLTHLAVGRVWPLANGTLDISFDMDPISGPVAAQALTKAAHTAGKKAILMVGGAGTNWNNEWTSATSAAYRANFIAHLTALATQLGFDGFDLDWEENINYAQFLTFTQQLRKAAPTKIITIPIGWVNPNWQQIDPFFKNVAASVDQLNIMTYGMADNWPQWWSWHSSALMGSAPSYPSSVDSSVSAYLAAGVPVAKLGVGIGFYGSCWSPPVTGPRQNLAGLNSHVIASDNDMTYANIMNLYYSGQNYRYDVLAQVPYLTSLIPMGPKQCTFVSYENETSVTAKGSYVKKKGLGGVIIWTINEGYNSKVANPNGLLQAVNKSLQ
jgi:chitinase